MIDDLNIPENVRQKIDEMIIEASKDIVMPLPLRHMLTSICFEMYKAGWRDGHRTMNRAIEISGALFKGR